MLHCCLRAHHCQDCMTGNMSAATTLQGRPSSLKLRAVCRPPRRKRMMILCLASMIVTVRAAALACAFLAARCLAWPLAMCGSLEVPACGLTSECAHR